MSNWLGVWGGGGSVSKRLHCGLLHDSWADGSRSVNWQSRDVWLIACCAYHCGVSVLWQKLEGHCYLIWLFHSRQKETPIAKGASHCELKNAFPTQSSCEWHIWHSQKLWGCLKWIRIVLAALLFKLCHILFILYLPAQIIGSLSFCSPCFRHSLMI